MTVCLPACLTKRADRVCQGVGWWNRLTRCEAVGCVWGRARVTIVHAQQMQCQAKIERNAILACFILTLKTYGSRDLDYITARPALYAVIVCLSVHLSVYHKSEFYKDD